MLSPEEISARMAWIVEDAFQSFNKELDTFHSYLNIDPNTIWAFLNRVGQHNWLFWGYEKVMRELGIGDANQLSRVAQIRAFVDHTQAEVQKVLNQNTQAQHNDRVMPDAFIDNTARLQEEFLRRKQMYKYMDRLRELTQGGMPMLQAQLIAKQETGYSG